MQKVILLVLVVMLALSGSVYAGGRHHCEKTVLVENDAEYQAGVGVDLTVFKAAMPITERKGIRKLIPDTVIAQNKWDFVNQNGGTYLVASYDVFELLKKKKTE